MSIGALTAHGSTGDTGACHDLMESQMCADKKPKRIFVPVYCPHCGESLNVRDNNVKIGIRYRDDEGYVLLSAILGDHQKVFREISVPEGEIARFYCPKPDCGKLLVSGEPCPVCQAPQIHLLARYYDKDEPIAICSRHGCHWHSIDPRKLVTDPPFSW